MMGIGIGMGMGQRQGMTEENGRACLGRCGLQREHLPKGLAAGFVT